MLGGRKPGRPIAPKCTTHGKTAKLEEYLFYRYRFRLQLENRPSDTTGHTLVKLRARREADFASLARVANQAGGRDLRAEPHTGAKLSKDVALVLENATSERQSGYSSTPDAFAHAVRVLVFGYALFFAGGPAGETWCDLDSACARISRVEQLVKLNRKSNHNLHARLMGPEMQMRAERARISQCPPLLSLGEIIEIVAQRHTFWPWVTEFRTPKNTRSDKCAQPYDNWEHQSDKGRGKGAFI